MKVRDVMKSNPALCIYNASLEDAAKLMLENDCGEIPVVNNNINLRPIGVITAETVCNALAEGKNVSKLTAGQYMTKPCMTLEPEMALEECDKIFEGNVRQMPVVDEDGCCCGMVFQSDLSSSQMKQKKDVLEEVVLHRR